MSFLLYMDLSKFIYIILFVAVMVLTFAMSALMLMPWCRQMFKAPVPHIHDTIGKLFIPWGITYLIFLPCIFLQINNDARNDFYYIITSLITGVMILSMSAWAYLAFLQQGVKQKILQPFVIALPLAITVWYGVSPADWLLAAFSVVLLVETVALIAYYSVLYRRFARDLRANYSNISRSMLRGIWWLWAIGVANIVIFGFCVAYDSWFWNMLNILANVLTAIFYIYTSENLMPLPEKEKVAHEEGTKGEDKVCDSNKEKKDAGGEQKAERNPLEAIPEALKKHCEDKLLFCNPNLTLNDLALALGTNRTYLSKWFSLNNTNFYNYINALRVVYAATLLEKSDVTIGQVQFESGFSSRTTFYKYFMQHYQCSPSEYRHKFV